MKPFEPKGAVVCVTGASSGIGAATAIALEKAGAHVVLAARRLDRLNALRATFQLPGEHLPVAMDVTVPASVVAAFAEIDRRFGKLDGLVANAGLGVWHRVHETSEEEMRKVLDTNLLGVVRCVREAVPRMVRSGGGRIVLVSSVVGRRGVPGMGLYSASKFALHGLADAMRIELEDEGIAVSTICPGLTRTEFRDAGTGAKGPDPSPTEGDSSEAVAAKIVECLKTGVPEAHMTGTFSVKRWAGVITQLFPRIADEKLKAYYRKRAAASNR